MASGKIKVKRLKLSDAMFGISLRYNSSSSHSPEALCRFFAENRINLRFISTQKSDAQSGFFCCMNASEQSAVERLIDKASPWPDTTCRIIPTVNLLSIFPHQSDTRMVFQLLQVLWDSQIPVHAVASSIAALTLVIDTNKINSTVEALKKFLDIKT